MTLRERLRLSLWPTPDTSTDYGITEALRRRKAARPDRKRAAGYSLPAQNWPAK